MWTVLSIRYFLLKVSSTWFPASPIHFSFSILPGMGSFSELQNLYNVKNERLPLSYIKMCFSSGWRSVWSEMQGFKWPPSRKIIVCAFKLPQGVELLFKAVDPKYWPHIDFTLWLSSYPFIVKDYGRKVLIKLFCFNFEITFWCHSYEMMGVAGGNTLVFESILE